MRYVEVGGARVSAVGLGTWQFGSREWGYGEVYARRETLGIVRDALDAGITLFDTAEIYAFGGSERILGAALDGRREEAFLATKVLPVFPLPPILERRARASVRRLGADRVDLFQLHWPNPVFPLELQASGLRRVLDAGLARHVGVSNFSLQRWRRLERALGRPVLSNQVELSLARSSPLRRLVPYAERTGRLLIAYSPLGQGLLTGTYDATNPPSGAVRRANVLFAAENLRRAMPLLDLLRTIGRAHNATPAQVALAWLLHRPNVVAIPGASRASQVRENAEAAELELTDEEDRSLTQEAESFDVERGPVARIRRYTGGG